MSREIIGGRAFGVDMTGLVVVRTYEGRRPYLGARGGDTPYGGTIQVRRAERVNGRRELLAEVPVVRDAIGARRAAVAAALRAVGREADAASVEAVSR